LVAAFVSWCGAGKPFKGLADANMTVQLLIGNASSPERPWENLPILTSADLPGQ
jgi:hypothetical protein